MNALLIQIIGFVAVGFSLAVFQVNRRSQMLLLQVAAALLYAVHFLLLGASTGAAMNLVSAVRNVCFDRAGTNRSWWLPATFILLFGAVTVVTWQGPLSLLPLGGMISGTLAFWQQAPRRIRLLALISPPLWFSYNLISGSYPGMLVEVIMFTSNVVGIYRFDIRWRFKKDYIARQT